MPRLSQDVASRRRGGWGVGVARFVYSQFCIKPTYIHRKWSLEHRARLYTDRTIKLLFVVTNDSLFLLAELLYLLVSRLLVLRRLKRPRSEQKRREFPGLPTRKFFYPILDKKKLRASANLMTQKRATAQEKTDRLLQLHEREESSAYPSVLLSLKVRERDFDYIPLTSEKMEGRREQTAKGGSIVANFLKGVVP